MYDKYNREINYLRISVTDRCNLRCSYCMPEEGIKLISHHDILSFEEIISFVNVAVKRGINKVRITGGEPLVRKGVVSFVSQLAAIPEIKDLSLTTNGILLEDFAKPLKEAGLHRVNISLDTMDAKKYANITRGGDLNKVIKGVDAAIEAGMAPVKVNCVINHSVEEPDAVAVKLFCDSKNIEARFISKMSLKHGTFDVVKGSTGGNCSICNRLRLSADGYLRPCLFNDKAFQIRSLGAEKAIDTALAEKPECGTFSNKNTFNAIGG